jgi:hypothetical protein
MISIISIIYSSTHKEHQVESTIVQFEGHSTFLKGLKMYEVASDLELALKNSKEKFYFFSPEQQSQNSVAVDPTKVVALYRHVDDR